MKIKRGPALFGATLGLSAVVTAGFQWTSVTAAWVMAALLRLVLPGDGIKPAHKVTAAVTVTGSVIVLSGVLLAGETAFPEDGTFPVVSLGMLYLFYRTMTSGINTGIRVENVLGLVLCGLLGTVLIFGMAEVQWNEALPTEFYWGEVLITFGLTAPWWCGAVEKKTDWGWFLGAGLSAVAICWMIRGTLGQNLAGAVDMPLYRAIETIKILGTLQRLEALLAAAILLGVYNMMVCVGEILRPAGERIFTGVNSKIWLGFVTGIIFLLELGYRMLYSGVQQRIGTVFWGLIPIFALWVVLFGKYQFSEKSS